MLDTSGIYQRLGRICGKLLLGQQYVLQFSVRPATQQTSAHRANYILLSMGTPIVMAIQALLFYIPCLIWRLLMPYSGFNVRKILQLACDSNLIIPDALNKNVRFMARYMEGCIYRQREYRRGVGVRFKHCLAKCSLRVLWQALRQLPSCALLFCQGPLPAQHLRSTLFDGKIHRNKVHIFWLQRFEGFISRQRMASECSLSARHILRF